MMSGISFRRAAAWLLPVLWIPVLSLAGPLTATENEGVGVLPLSASAIEALARSPSYQAARGMVDAERYLRRQLVVGAQEWTGTAYAARRRENVPGPERTTEWDIGLERAVRLPGKARIHEEVGDARLEQAKAAQRRVWREQARLLLERYGSWVREKEHARVQIFQLALWQRQLDAVSRRQRIGDAAKIEERQAEAALKQAQVQSQSAQHRVGAARESLERQFPGLALPPEMEMPTPLGGLINDQQWLFAQTTTNPDFEFARLETRVADALLKLDSAERHPDPTIGVRVGQARSGNERFVGVTLSVPLAGEYRAAGAAAAGARAVAASLREQDAERKGEADAILRLREAHAAYAAWLGNNEATKRLQEVASSLQRGYALGEGSLTDVLAAQRLANEQRLLTASSAVDAWVTRYRLELEADVLWPEPAADK